MMKFSTKIIITVAALMFSAVQSYASETCAADVNTCTPKQLCEASTSIVNNNKVWSVDPAYVEHVAMSKQLGINCGVVDVVAPTCETDAELCAVSALCEQATVASGSAKAWSEAAGKAGHVSLAKEYGLACDVINKVKNNSPCNYFTPQNCSNERLCAVSTYQISGSTGREWSVGVASKEANKRGLTCGTKKQNDKSCSGSHLSVCSDAQVCDNMYMMKDTSVYINYTDEANKRGLTCSAPESAQPKQCRAKSPAGCDDSTLCSRAITNGNWNGLLGYVNEARKRGLTCGVVEVNKSCSYGNPAGCNQTTLCFRATKNGTWNPYVNEAKKRGLTCGVGSGSTTIYADAFKSQSLLKRQQLQYALKKLGFYSSSIDGLWGNGTSSAIVEYAQANGIGSNSPSNVFSTILSKVDVPTSFSTQEKIVTKAKTGSEFVCKTNKIYVKSSLFEISTNTGMTKIEVGSEGQKKQLTSTEAKALIKEFQADEPTYLKFNGDKVSFNNSQFNDKKISELLESESPENRAALKKAVQQVMAPKTYKTNNNVASWSLRFPKVFGVGDGILDNSFNLETHQYTVKTKMNLSGMDEINMKLWATCSLY